MRWSHRPQTVLLVLALVALSGCSARLEYNKNVTVDALGVERIYWDEPLVEKATVTIKSPNAKVDVYLVLQSNEEAARRALDTGKAPKDVLASAEKTEDKVFEIAPGKKPFALFLRSTSKRAEVSVKVSGK